MIDQHKQIEGYRDFKQETINLINEIKGTGNSVVKPLIDKIKSFHDAELQQMINEIGALPAGVQEGLNPEQQRLVTEGARCSQQAEEHFRLGFMMLIRSVARPTTEY